MDLETLKESLVRREAVLERPPPTALPSARLEDMAQAADDIEECLRVLKKGGSNLVAEVLRGQGEFVQWNHYPKGDIYDSDSHSQYYYHAHPSNNLRGLEHGHFHTFVRAPGMPKGVAPAPLPTSVERPTGKKALSHLVAVSMDKHGFPTRIFTTNRWVTGESWYGADDVLRLLDQFVIDHAVPSWPTNRWIGALLRLFRPQIEWLLRERDDAIRVWQAGHPDSVVYEDHELEVPSVVDISVEGQAARVRRAIENRAIEKRRG